MKNIGDVYGDYTIVEKIKNKYKVKCSVCGRTQVVTKYAITKRNNTHGNICSKILIRELTDTGVIQRYAKEWHFYSAWSNMKTRCKPNYKKRHCYYDKGIRCDDYRYFVDFYDGLYQEYLQKCSEVGEENTTLDRVDNSKGYTPDNCRWASWSEQIENKDSLLRFKATAPNKEVFYGVNLKSFCEENSLNYNTVMVGIHQGNKSWKNGWFFEVCND